MTGSIKSEVKIYIRGPFSVTGKSGTDLTPKSKKTQGLIALLSTSNGCRRTRAFLQNHLWSDRGQEQGAASLRQSLSELRRLFKDYGGLLISDRSAVWLDQDRVELIEPDSLFEQPLEPFEGLDVRDAAFQSWLEELRGTTKLHHATVAPTLGADAKQQIIFVKHSNSWGELSFAEEVMSDLIAKTIREQVSVDIHFEPPPVTQPGAVIVDIQAFAPHGGYGMRSAVQTVENGSVIWSDMQPIPTLPGFGTTPPELLAASARVAHAVLRHFVDSDERAAVNRDANVLALLGMHKIFSLDASQTSDARALLKAAYAREPRGVYLAWRAQLCTVEFAEGHRDRAEMADEAERLVAKALEHDGDNSLALTIAANCNMVFGRDPETAGQLATMAVRANPANAMAWWVLGHVQLYAGQYQESYLTSLRGQKLAQGTHLQFWLDFQQSLAAAFCGKLDVARVHSQSAAVLRPEFRAAHRFALALHSAADDKDRSREAVRKLSLLEDGFTPQKLAFDKDYPASLIRQMPFFAPAKIVALEE